MNSEEKIETEKQVVILRPVRLLTVMLLCVLILVLTVGASALYSENLAMKEELRQSTELMKIQNAEMQCCSSQRTLWAKHLNTVQAAEKWVDTVKETGKNKNKVHENNNRKYIGIGGGE